MCLFIRKYLYHIIVKSGNGVLDSWMTFLYAGIHSTGPGWAAYRKWAVKLKD